MDFGEMFKIIRRRWLISVPAFALSLIVICGAWVALPTKYQSQIQLTLLDSRSVASAQGNAGNPYLDFSPALDAVVDLLARNLSSDQSISQLKALGVTYPFTAGIATNAQGPFLALVVTGRSKVKIEQSIPIIVNFARQRLTAMQQASSAPESTLIQLVPIAPASAPTHVLKTKVEVVAGVGIICLVGSILLTFIVDTTLTRRARRRTYPEAKAQPTPSRGPIGTRSEPPPASLRTRPDPRAWPERSGPTSSAPPSRR